MTTTRKKLGINLITCALFILSMFFFRLRTMIPDTEVNGEIIEQGFGYSAIGALLFILGIIIVCIRIGIFFYKRQKLN